MSPWARYFRGETGQHVWMVYRAGGIWQAASIGIGFYLTRQITEKQRGYVKVESTPEVRNIFSLYIPWESSVNSAQEDDTVRNEYENEAFFQQYAQMSRSREGLSAAGEWHQLRPLFPPLEGKSLLDLGCGYGWHCKFVVEQGARHVLGIDISQKMIEEARRRNSGEGIRYRVCGIDAYEYPEAAWDCVVSNLALHYIEDLDAIFKKVHRTLKEDGIFLINIEHPVFTAGVGQDWAYGEDGTPLYWPIDQYFMPGERVTHFLGCEVRKQHHTLTQILMGLLRSGFILEAVEEAEPSEEMLDIPGMRDELRRPMMLLVRARAAH